MSYAAQVQSQSRGLSLGAAMPRRLRTNADYGRGLSNRPMSLGQVGGSCPPSVNSTGCVTFQDPEIPGCPGYNGCGDTIGITAVIGASVQNFLIQVQAPTVFTPRLFYYNGPAATFAIVSVKVANGADSHFGPAYSADIYGLAAFTRKEVSWPTFYNAPPLEIRVNNLTAAQATFSGTLIGVAAHQ